MKKVMLLLAIAIGFVSCSIRDESKYTIKDANGNAYSTDNYNVENGCISFKCNVCNEERPTTICGSYTVLTNQTK